MIILTPYPNLAFCATVFNDRDLFDHQYATMVVLTMLATEEKPPASWKRSYEAWEYYPRALLHYHNTLVLEWDRRGFAPLFRPITTIEQAEAMGVSAAAVHSWFDQPSWLGWPELHSSHRASLRIRNRRYRELWTDSLQPMVVWPGRRVPPGKYIVKGKLTGLVIELHRWDMEVMVRGNIQRFKYEQVERKRWVPDHLPLHERLALEYPEQPSS